MPVPAPTHATIKGTTVHPVAPIKYNIYFMEGIPCLDGIFMSLVVTLREHNLSIRSCRLAF
jgi:hypothetical protein